jgi:hypothetical protein
MRFDRITLGGAASDLHDSIQIAVANTKVSEEDIRASFLGSPNVSEARREGLARLLNEIWLYRAPDHRRIDLVVLPEVSIPQEFLPMVVAWARRRRIGVVCGLEHRVDAASLAYNEVVTILPYLDSSRHWVCAPIRRLKRHYSPHEKFVLANNYLGVPDTSGIRYQLFNWRGVAFAVYNCFELASIQDRALFMGKVDFLVAVEYNHDINYFSNIVESAARDIHCYVIQVNSSDFGDSRVVAPARTDAMTPLQIKGGDNRTFLTLRLDLGALRAHQRLGYGLQKDSKRFKPTPPGFRQADVLTRVRLGGRLSKA